MHKYKTLIFDCDGVILDSNKVKSDAFYQVTLPYGEDSAKSMLEYHIANGGISRFAKFEYFLKYINPIKDTDEKIKTFNNLLFNYSRLVIQGLNECEIAEGLAEFREKTKTIPWIIVSGGEQTELRQVFSTRGIAEWFDGGIFGSPDTKETILAREIETGNIIRPGLFIGDSKYDLYAATKSGLDFVFITQWTEIKNYKLWQEDNALISYSNINDMLISGFLNN